MNGITFGACTVAQLRRREARAMPGGSVGLLRSQRHAPWQEFTLRGYGKQELFQVETAIARLQPGQGMTLLLPSSFKKEDDSFAPAIRITRRGEGYEVEKISGGMWGVSALTRYNAFHPFASDSCQVEAGYQLKMWSGGENADSTRADTVFQLTLPTPGQPPAPLEV